MNMSINNTRIKQSRSIMQSNITPFIKCNPILRSSINKINLISLSIKLQNNSHMIKSTLSNSPSKSSSSIISLKQKQIASISILTKLRFTYTVKSPWLVNTTGNLFLFFAVTIWNMLLNLGDPLVWLYWSEFKFTIYPWYCYFKFVLFVL